MLTTAKMCDWQYRWAKSEAIFAADMHEHPKARAGLGMCKVRPARTRQRGRRTYPVSPVAGVIAVGVACEVVHGGKSRAAARQRFGGRHNKTIACSQMSRLLSLFEMGSMSLPWRGTYLKVQTKESRARM